MKKQERIYLDNQASTRVDPRVVQTMEAFSGEKFGNPHSTEHSFGWGAAREIEEAAAMVAGLVGAEAVDVVFTAGATEANNLAIRGLVEGATSSKRHRILVSAAEHKSVLACALRLQERGFAKVDLVPVDERGLVRLDELMRLIDENVLLVSVMAVNNEVGAVQPIDSVAQIVHSVGAWLHCDAVQAPCAGVAGTLADVADLITLSAHKIYGPMGIGALIGTPEVWRQIEPLLQGGGQQSGRRGGTVATALCVGFGRAASLMLSDSVERERELIASLRDDFLMELERLGVRYRVNGPPSYSRHPGNANLLLDDVNAQDILLRLQPQVAASSGSACTSGIPEPSHVLTAMGVCKEDAERSIRFSFGRFNTAAEALRAANLLADAITHAKRSELF